LKSKLQKLGLACARVKAPRLAQDKNVIMPQDRRRNRAAAADGAGRERVALVSGISRNIRCKTPIPISAQRRTAALPGVREGRSVRNAAKWDHRSAMSFLRRVVVHGRDRVEVRDLAAERVEPCGTGFF
jgi:hypothetical protein